MTKEIQDQIIASLNAYADKVLGNIDPQKVKIGQQLAALKPEMERLAKVHNIELEDLFILYMDRCSEVFAQEEQNIQDMLKFM